jgi:alkanesulfonate monooxygenase SsuD/methylene tetrahydromethanopterin reductase-like flavin-dependent oxidoreductase (luciferase family)
MIGGAGERKTLRTVARYADMWNMSGTPERVKHKIDVLDQHCADVGRDPAQIERTISCKLFLRDSEAEARRLLERSMEQNQTPMSEIDDDVTFWVDTPERTVERLLEYRAMGVNTFIPEIPAPYDDETLTRLVTEVKPQVERAS